MSVPTVARKEFADTLRSRWLLGLSLLFTVLLSLAVVASAWLVAGRSLTSTELLRGLLIQDGLVTTFLPIVALIASYSAVVGERSSGSLKLLLSLPHSRADVIAGKVLGRSASMVTALLVGFLVPAVIIVVADTLSMEAVAYVQYVFFVLVLGMAFVAVGVGVSATTSSNRLAIAAAIGVYLFFVTFLGGVQGSLGIVDWLAGWPEWMPLTVDETNRVLRLLNPTGSFKIVTNGALGGDLFFGDQKWLQRGAMGMLVAWIVFPPVLGYLWFDAADL